MATENGSARIGKSVVIRGEVKGGEDLIIDGRVEGTVTLTESRLTIGPSANIAADLAARDMLIQGQVQGNIVATGRVELRAGCWWKATCALCDSRWKTMPYSAAKSTLPRVPRPLKPSPATNS